LDHRFILPRADPAGFTGTFFPPPKSGKAIRAGQVVREALKANRHSSSVRRAAPELVQVPTARRGRWVYRVDVPPLRIDIWSDIACPWCYIGKRHLEQALEKFPHRDEVAIVWRAFELDPSAPSIRDTSQSYAERLANKYGTQLPKAQAMIDRMVDTAANDGLEFRFDRIRPGNTFDAHRLLHLAHERGRQDALKERMLRAYMTEGQAIGDRDVLITLAREAGLDEAEARDVLGGDRYAAQVRRDEVTARELGINGVPFFVMAERLGVSGAQPAEVLLGALERAWSELHKSELATFAEGAVCGPDGCA
jgi:predicted DsbA family dithiol-disulfide isomerase